MEYVITWIILPLFLCIRWIDNIDELWDHLERKMFDGFRRIRKGFLFSFAAWANPVDTIGFLNFGLRIIYKSNASLKKFKDKKYFF